MTWKPHRRGVLAGIGTASLSLLAAPAIAQAQPRIIIVGGGFGGAAAARFLKAGLPDARITLIEPQKRYIACPLAG